MEILREALIFFAIVFLIVGGAVYLSDRAPDAFSTGEQANVSAAPASNVSTVQEVPPKPLAKLFFRATVVVEPPVSFSGTQANGSLTLTYAGGEVPFSIGGSKIRGAEGTHHLVLRNYSGSLEMSRAADSKCNIRGGSSEVSFDALTFSEGSLPVAGDVSCSVLSSDSAVLTGIFAVAKEGLLNVTGNSALFSLNAGDSIDIGEFIGSVQFNAVTNELVLDGFSYSILIKKSGGSTINIS